MRLLEKYTMQQWRGIRGMSKEALANKSGVSSATISAYEKDVQRLRNGKYETIESIAVALDIKVSDIFLDPTSEKPKQPKSA